MSWKDLNITHIDTPALIIDQDIVQDNIEAAIRYAGGVDRLRPHAKTHKILEVAKMQLAAGITKFKCATIPEAEMLGMAGADDVLLAYQPQGPKIDRILLLQLKFPETTFNVLVDNIDSALLISEQCDKKNQRLNIFFDLNVGQNRSGISPQNARELFLKCKDLNGIHIQGLHCYDGHIRMSDLEDRISESTQAFKSVIQLKNEIESHGLPMTLVAGGSPSFSVHAQYHNVECSPGTFVFWDVRYSGDYPELPFKKAAILASRVISKIDSYTYCLDLGHKSVASEMPFPRVDFLSDLDLKQIGHSEEHLVIQSSDPDVLKVGQLLYAYPYHICPTVALYNEIHVCKKDKIIAQWKVIARDRKITI